MALFQPTGSIDEQLNWIISNVVIYKLQFFMAFLISPSLIYMMIIQLDKSPAVGKVNMRLGLIFFAVYVVLSSISYASQIILIPGFIEAGLIEQAKVWYFGSFTSISYFMNQMGYFFWSVGAIILYIEFVNLKGIIKYLSIIYLTSAFLSIIAFIGLILSNESINFMTLIGGLVLIPTGIMTVIWGYREQRIIK
jgi:hypothetical protein